MNPAIWSVIITIVMALLLVGVGWGVLKTRQANSVTHKEHTQLCTQHKEDCKPVSQNEMKAYITQKEHEVTCKDVQRDLRLDIKTVLEKQDDHMKMTQDLSNAVIKALGKK